MKSPIRIIAIAAALALAVTPFAVAQMMHGNQTNVPSENVVPNSHSGMMEGGMMGNGMMGMGMMGMMSHMNTMMGNMSKYYTTMSTDLDKLDSHLDKMMQIDDINTLKVELKKHQEMTRELRKAMTGQQNWCPNMMSMTATGSTNCMMGANTPNAAGVEQTNSSLQEK